LTGPSLRSTVGLVQSLVPSLREFVVRHRPHGQLTADASEPQPDGYMLRVYCPCGVWYMRWMVPAEAARDVVLTELLPSGS
jgi:hypothetical protein